MPWYGIFLKKADSYSAGQNISCYCWTQSYVIIITLLPLDLNLSQFNPVHILKIHFPLFNMILIFECMESTPKWSLLFKVSIQNYEFISCSLCMSHASHPPWFKNPNKLWSSQSCNFLHPPVISSLLNLGEYSYMSKYSPRHCVLKHTQSVSYLF
jgi:hypothetical protein